MKRKDIIDCIILGYEGKDPEELPLDIIHNDEAQYAYEFGSMMEREGMEINDDDMDEYIKDILFDSDSELTLNDLK